MHRHGPAHLFSEQMSTRGPGFDCGAGERRERKEGLDPELPSERVVGRCSGSWVNGRVKMDSEKSSLKRHQKYRCNLYYSLDPEQICP